MTTDDPICDRSTVLLYPRKIRLPATPGSEGADGETSSAASVVVVRSGAVAMEVKRPGFQSGKEYGCRGFEEEAVMTGAEARRERERPPDLPFPVGVSNKPDVNTRKKELQ